MKKIKVFTDKSIEIDLPTFVDSRALFCANCGGGKSYAIRKLLEKSHGKVMALVLDVEGEFKTLREKFDFLLIGSNGDVQINIKSAGLLPKKLLDLNVSTIIDISDFKRSERIEYVKKFLESLMELPRKLWKPCLVILDEAHLLCGQQEKQDSYASVIDLMTRGRKRGYCGVLCTQRVAKLHKDAVAEANNIMIGRTGLDIDMKRAAEILGFTSKKDMLSLRDLRPGEFYVFGTAISRHVTKARIGEVITTHPKVGMDLRTKIVQPTDKIKRMLSKLSDLPKEAEKELKTLQSMKKEINTLMMEKRKLEFELKKKKPELDPDVTKSLSRINYERGYNQAIKEGNAKIREITAKIKPFDTAFSRIAKIVSEFKDVKFTGFKIEPKTITPTKTPVTPRHIPSPPIPISTKELEEKIPAVYEEDDAPLKKGAMNMLNWLGSFHPSPLTRQRLATLSGFTASGGTFGSYLSQLKKKEWVAESGESLSITEEGLEHSKIIEVPSKDQLIEMWAGKFKKGAGEILREVCKEYPMTITKEEVGIRTGFTPEGGTFQSYVSQLRKNGLITIQGQEIKAADELFE